MTEDEAWTLAEQDAKRQFADAAMEQNFNDDFTANNPYDADDERYEEYECAFEHFIMTALGY